MHRKRGGIFEEVPSSGGVLRYVVSDIDPTDSTRVRYGAWQRVPNRTLREREGRSMFEDRDFATADASINTSGREPVVIGWEDEEEAWHWHRLTDLACFSRTPGGCGRLCHGASLSPEGEP